MARHGWLADSELQFERSEVLPAEIAGAFMDAAQRLVRHTVSFFNSVGALGQIVFDSPNQDTEKDR